MGHCIICDAEVDGADICAFHEEDVLFTFTGSSPSDLIPGRYYQGTVDGYADFGVFIDLGNGVTGLLHRNELDRRLESLDWEPGDTVCVQVDEVADDGDVDLSPSIRQSPEEFRGTLEHGAGEAPAPEPTTSADMPDASSITSTHQPYEHDLDRAQIRSIDRYFGREILLEGVVEDIRQTGGPTVFTLRDESGTVECAAFAGAGVRAYPDVSDGDVVRVLGGVEHRYDDFQIEVESLDRITDDDADRIRERVADGAKLPASIDELPLLYNDAANDAIETDLREAAAAIRRAVERGQPIRIRHPTSVDGYVAGAAMERAIRQAATSAGQLRPDRAVRRRPLTDQTYDVAAALSDTVQLLDSADEDPFVLLVGVGSALTETAPFDLLDAYDIGYYIVDASDPNPITLDRVDPLVNPWCGEGTFPIPTTTAVAINVAGLVSEDVRDDLRHLPAVSDHRDRADTASILLEESPFGEADVDTMHEAVTLEAYYQPWEDKRALIRAILFEREAGTSEPISEQYRTKLSTAVETAVHNAEAHRANGAELLVLDVEAFGNRFEFPPVPVLLRGLVESSDADDTIAVGIDRDQLAVSDAERIDLEALADQLSTEVPDGGVMLERHSDGGIVRFLSGRREAIASATVPALESALSA